MQTLSQDQITTIWNKVFDNRLYSISKGALSGKDSYFKGYLAHSKNQWNNGISHNDPLSFMFEYDEQGNYKEHNLHLTVKPDNKYMAYGSIALRKQSIKNLTPEKLEKRLVKIRDFIMENTDKMTDSHKHYVK